MTNSYRQILRSSWIIGGASAANIVLGLFRTKVAALLLGPLGIGILGLLQQLLATSSAAAALGFGNVGTRVIAEANAHDDARSIASARLALSTGTAVLAVIGSLVVWSLRNVLATAVLDDPSMGSQVGQLAIGVGLTVAAGSQAALLTGLRRVEDVARVSVGAAAVSAGVGSVALWAWGIDGAIVSVLAAPAASVAIGHWYVAKLPSYSGESVPFAVVAKHWKSLATLGASFMLAGFVAAAGQLAVRTMVQRRIGTDALGNFQAAWMITMTYTGFVLGAMGTDFYPRLTAAMRDPVAASRLVNEQSEVALLLAGPAVIAMLAFAPWIVHLLYSSHFSDAVAVLRVQLVGDVLKVASWPVGFVILAGGDGRTFLTTETLVTLAFALLVSLGLPSLGVHATGVAFVAMYAINLPLVYWLARRRIGFSWERRVAWQFAVLLGIAIAVYVAGTWSRWVGAAVGGLATAALAVHGIARLGHMADLEGRAGRIARQCRLLMTRTGLWHE